MQTQTQDQTNNATRSAAADPADAFGKAFGPPIEPDIFAPRVDANDCIDGVIAKHVETRVIEYMYRGEPRRSRLHTFASRGGSGARFALFGAAGLDGQLRKLAAGAVVFLQYKGKRTQTDNPEQEEHTWLVRSMLIGADRNVSELLERDPWRAMTAAFDRAIEKGRARDAERSRKRRSTGSDEAGPERPFSDEELAEHAG